MRGHRAYAHATGRLSSSSRAQQKRSGTTICTVLILILIQCRLLQMYRLTVRSSKESVSVEVCDLLADQF